ncbi:hypothetical protein H9638_01485 [Arthrobacter sp. Sa2BUA2]|uniref:DUF308 domain-containing protein n=1 Tax=Arthrobacter pullicola TaxID=2762224 RepID=A0ABR8YE40_9MICC|nr:DUF308 domain-containing protein [Arthrobacter pullicola]MBD8042475.1 hypothetical protein [Arthrobacter pullicola]
MGVSHPKAPWIPILLRSVIAAVYGAVTIFWQEPTVAVLALAGGIYLVLTGVSVWRMSALAKGCGVALVPAALLAAAAVYAVAGVLVAVVQSAEVFAYTAGAALLIGGVIELVLWFRARKQFVPARDWLITGVVGIGAGVLMPVFLTLPEGSHVQALLGVSGGAAVITAVILAISGLGLRHDASLARDSEEASKAVN